MLKLRTERLRRGWSQTQVTLRTGITPADLSMIERGLRPAYPGWRRRLSEAFALPEDYLFAEDTDALEVA
ncbi:MAG: helix-turn-helix transcriptional regulator [Vicinamibacterales bacterium]|nr:helix-turn-helix transcriptional regulator [Vicinamibacterales bacterium]